MGRDRAVASAVTAGGRCTPGRCSADFQSLDPAFGWPLPASTTCANLVTYPVKRGPEGARIVPEVAEAVPAPTAGGTTYTFRIRPGFRFSPPSNEAVTALTFKSTIERVANPRLGSPLAKDFSGVVGYHAYSTGKARTLSGVVARGRTLTIRLSRPDGGFLGSLAAGSACAVPRDTPAARGMNDIPSAGPYYVASYTPRQQLVLRRNPNYGGDRPRHLEQIVVSIGVDPVARARAGRVRNGRLRARAAARGGTAPGVRATAPAAKPPRRGTSSTSSARRSGVRILHMNTSRPLFSDVRLRRAVNYAIDRRALAAQGRRAAEVNPFNAGSPTDDYVPRSFPGAADFHLYPLDRPDLRRAKRLAGHVRATAIMYTPNLSPWREEAQIVRRNLKPLGIDVEVKEFPIGDFFTRVTRRGEPFDLAVSGYTGSLDAVAVPGLPRRRRLRTSRTSTIPSSAGSSLRPRSCRARSVTEPLPGSRSSSSATPSRRPRSRRRRAATSSRRGSGARCTTLSGAWTSALCACGSDTRGRRPIRCRTEGFCQFRTRRLSAAMDLGSSSSRIRWGGQHAG